MQTTLIVGLGNPGKKYEETRHNLGFMLLDLLAKELHVLFEPSKRFQGLVATGLIDEHKLILLKPQTYMNLSGESVSNLIKYYQLDEKSLLVVSDDSDIPFGTLRLRERGSAGGHRGLKNIEDHLRSQEYARLRIGIGKPEFGELESFVLMRFPKSEQALLPKILERGSEIIKIWLNEGFSKAATFAGSFHATREKTSLE